MLSQSPETSELQGRGCRWVKICFTCALSPVPQGIRKLSLPGLRREQPAPASPVGGMHPLPFQSAGPSGSLSDKSSDILLADSTPGSPEGEGLLASLES